MRKISSALVLPIITGCIIILTGSAFMGYKTSGSPGGYSGSPLDGKNCTSCHSGTATPQAGIITSDIDTSGYIPGSNYTITVSIPGAGLKGFEVSPLNSANQKAGTLASGTDPKLTNSSIAVTHSITSGSDPAVWAFQWTAPAIGTGIVTFYGAFTASKLHTLLSTMVVKEKKTVSIATENSPQINIRFEVGCNKLYFTTITTHPQSFSAKIYSIDGKIVLRISEKELTNGLNKWETDISGLKTLGIYILEYSIGDLIETRKIFIN